MARPYLEVGGDDVLVGSVVAERYHVAGILGQGTTGTVFGVEHIHIGRRGAMKVLRPRSTPADVVHRVFNGDARAAWSVSHPCLADVFDVGTLPDGAPFFCSEYLEGETLAKRMTRDRLSIAAAVDVMMQILSAIAAVHERALLVRDLRPQNVFLVHRRGCRPIAKILDLGLGRLMPLEAVAEQWEADPAAAAASLPHPFYLSPERTRSEHGIDFASDLFVAGVIFYEMLTGRRPFSAASYNGLLLQIAQANPTPVSEVREHSLAELDEFVERALTGNPRSRFASAKEMQDELRRVFESQKKTATVSTVSAAVQATSAERRDVPPSGSIPGPTLAASAGMPSMPPSPSLPFAAPPPKPSQRQSQRAFPKSAPMASPLPAPPTASPMASPMASSKASPMASAMLGGAPRSAAVSSVNPIASELEPISPRETTLAMDAPTATTTERPPDLDPDLYSDETETDRRFFDLAPYRDPASSARLPASRPNSSKPRFESETAHKTVPPETTHGSVQPPTIQAFEPIKIGSADDFEEPTESRNALSDEMLRSIREDNKTPPPPAPDEETQQLEMTPELRAKIEAQYAARPVPPAPVPRQPVQPEMDSIPPPTKRLDR